MSVLDEVVDWLRHDPDLTEIVPTDHINIASLTCAFPGIAVNLLYEFIIEGLPTVCLIQADSWFSGETAGEWKTKADDVRHILPARLKTLPEQFNSNIETVKIIRSDLSVLPLRGLLSPTTERRRVSFDAILTLDE